MPWARIDDRANSDAKLLALSDSAYRMWVAGLIFCQANLTDGFIPKDAIQTFGVRARNKTALVRELTKAVLGKRPLWQAVDGGWMFNDFHDWNDSREVVLKKRAKGKNRIDKFRAKLNGGNAAGNALQTANETDYERSSFAASTSTTTDQKQNPSAAAPIPFRRRRQEARRLVEVRRHLLSACHRLIETDPECHPSHPFESVNLFAKLKDAAGALQVVDYSGREIDKLINAVIARRAKRRHRVLRIA